MAKVHRHGTGRRERQEPQATLRPEVAAAEQQAAAHYTNWHRERSVKATEAGTESRADPHCKAAEMTRPESGP